MLMLLWFYMEILVIAVNGNWTIIKIISKEDSKLIFKDLTFFLILFYQNKIHFYTIPKGKTNF
jgi:hypothetical protein